MGRLRETSLATKLAVFAALLTAVVTGGAFAALRLSIADNVRRVFTSELHATQDAVREVEASDRQLLLQNARLIADMPGLRSAVQVWQDASAGTPEERAATLDSEIRRAFDNGLDADALLITDDTGLVITSAGREHGVPAGKSLIQLPAVRAALSNGHLLPTALFGVLRDGPIILAVAAVPMIIDGKPVGALVLGRRIDRILSADSAIAQAVVVANRTVLASTLPSMPAGAHWMPRWALDDPGPASLTIAGKDYARATIDLGRGEDGQPVQLHLLRSLNAAVSPIESGLTFRFLLAGVMALLLIIIGAVWLSTTTLRPLDRFVSFIQSAAGSDYGRFVEPHAPREIRTLTDSYNRLIESMEIAHEELRLRTIDLAKANHRVNRQIDRRERAEQALRDSEEQLRQVQKLEALGALAGGVAHDFNNILSIILGYTEIVQNDLPEESRQRADVAKINDAAMRARTLVKQLLAFSRKQVLQPTILSLNDVVRDVTALLDPLLGSQIRLEIRLDPALNNVKADPVQIEQVILNLAVNARDAMPEGGSLLIETANVTLDERSADYPLRAGSAAMLSVTDTGTGMDAATRRRIFEPFFTTKPVGKGTGLGLATVYGIVRQSEGNITVFSTPGEGTTFRCYFPSVDAPIESVAAIPEVTSRAPAAGSSVLVVDDDADVRELLARSLEGAGYRVRTAHDGPSALTVAQELGSFDLLITDIVMPEMPGNELAHQLLLINPSLKVVFVSGYSLDAIDRHGQLVPDCVYLQKPVVHDTLINAVRDLLDTEFATTVIQ